MTRPDNTNLEQRLIAALQQEASLAMTMTDTQRELDRLQEIELNKDGRRVIMRTPATGVIGPLFKAARVALPANIREPAAI